LQFKRVTKLVKVLISTTRAYNYKLRLHQSIPVIWKRHCEHRHSSPAHSSLSSYAPAPPTAADCA